VVTRLQVPLIRWHLHPYVYRVSGAPAAKARSPELLKPPGTAMSDGWGFCEGSLPGSRDC